MRKRILEKLVHVARLPRPYTSHFYCLYTSDPDNRQMESNASWRYWLLSPSQREDQSRQGQKKK